MHRVLFGLAVVASLAVPVAAFGNDSSAEIAVGGLTLTQSDDIRMDSEDLFLSKDEVRVSYRFTNTSDQDIETMVAFPLPDIVPSDYEGDNPSPDYKNALEFKTKVNGKPVALALVQQAFLNDVDVTEQLQQLGLPLIELDDAAMKAINDLPAEQRKQLVSDGLLKNAEGSTDFWIRQWTVKTTVTRSQVFPAGETIAVEHRYRPLAGGSVGGGLDPSYRNSADGKEWFEKQRDKFCIDKDWLTSFDKQGNKRKGESSTFLYSETWLGYVLSSGANWKGPIGDFRLVVDKGDPDAMVSFCAKGVKKISPTQFEVRARDFEPSEDLNILIINWYKPE